jgi:hypothetical protein
MWRDVEWREGGGLLSFLLTRTMLCVVQAYSQELNLVWCCYWWHLLLLWYCGWTAYLFFIFVAERDSVFVELLPLMGPLSYSPDDKWTNMERWRSDNWKEPEVLKEKPVWMPCCPPKTSHQLPSDWTKVSAVKSELLIAWAVAQPV